MQQNREDKRDDEGSYNCGEVRAKGERKPAVSIVPGHGGMSEVSERRVSCGGRGGREWCNGEEI